MGADEGCKAGLLSHGKSTGRQYRSESCGSLRFKEVIPLCDRLGKYIYSCSIHDKRGIRSAAHLGVHSITPLDTFFSHIALPTQCYLTDCPPPFSRVARITYVATRPQPCKDPAHRSSSLANAYKYTSTAHQRAGKLSGVKAKGYSNIGTIFMATAHPLDDFFDESNAWCLQALLNRMNRLLCLQCPHPACFR